MTTDQHGVSLNVCNVIVYFSYHNRLNQRLDILEAECGITQRWDTTHPQYVKCVHSQATEAQQQSKSSLYASVAKRRFLLKLKAKYAGIIIKNIYHYQILNYFYVST